jgi:hypothetical protein
LIGSDSRKNKKGCDLVGLLEFAENHSQASLTAWQREFIPMVEVAINENKILVCRPARNIGRTMVKNLVNQFYGRTVIH